VKHISRYSGNFSAPLSVATPVNASMWKLALTISDQPRVSRKSGLGRLSEFFVSQQSCFQHSVTVAICWQHRMRIRLHLQRLNITIPVVVRYYY